MACRNIISPITKEKVQSQTWNAIRDTVETDQEADRLYGQLTTPEFYNWFGDWVNNPGGEDVSKVVNEHGEPLVVYHGTGKEFDTFDKELRGDNTGKSADGLKNFDAENAFFFTDNKNVAFNYALLGRQQELQFILWKLHVITSTLSWNKSKAPEAYKELREKSPKFAQYVDNLKEKGLDQPAIMEEMKKLYKKYNSLRDLTNGGAISNSSRYYNDVQDSVNKLITQKSSILGGFYQSVSKYGDNSSFSTTGTGYNSLHISSNGLIYGSQGDDFGIKDLYQKNITELSSGNFDRLVKAIEKTVVSGKQRVADDVKRGGFTPYMMPLFLNIKNPIQKDFKGIPFVQQDDGSGALIEVSKMVKEAAQNPDVDGVFIQQVADPELADNYAVFEPNQIKSINNSGTFSSGLNSIYYQLTSNLSAKADEQLNIKLVDFLRPLGVTVEMLDNLKERVGVDSLGASDIINKIIAINKNEQKLDTLPEEVGHFFVEFLGNKNIHVRTLLKNITEWEGYQAVKDEYFDKYNGNEIRIKKEAIGKLIGEYIVKHKDAPRSLLESIKKIIHDILTAFSIERMDARGIAEDIATDILMKNYSKIKRKMPEGARLTDYQESLTRDKQVHQMVDKLRDAGFYLTGSLALRKQGTLYRSKNENLHDLDFIVPEHLKSNWRELVDEIFPNVQKPVVYDFVQGGDEITGLEINDIVVDFFRNNRKVKTDGENNNSWQNIMYAKLGMDSTFLGRDKDIIDFTVFQPFDKSTSFTDENMVYFQQSNNGTPVNENIDEKVNQFLSSIGVNVNKVDNIKDKDGNIIDAVAKADMLNKIIEVVNGKADITTLPEEAAHFFVELLGEEHPLYKRMFKEITRYKLYAQTVEEYKNNPEYRNPDGTINFNKLKKEAIAKVIVEHIIQKHSGEEDSTKLAQLSTWWDRVWDFIKGIFKQAKNNPFEVSASKILNNDTKGLKKITDIGSTDEFYQLDNTVSKLVGDQSRIVLDNSIDPATKEKKHIYKVDGKPVKGSVTELVVKPWYKKQFPTDSRTDVRKKIDTLKAEFGDNIHQDIEHIGNRYVDSVTHELKATPDAVTKMINNATVYSKLESYVGELLQSYPAGTKFFFESKIYDPKKDMAGSVDMIALLKDGSADIYDWKSQEIGKDEEELKWFKEPAYRLQLDEYAKILKTYYGIDKINKTRAIPIKTLFKVKKEGTNFVPKVLTDIEIGTVDPKLTPDAKSYLLPIVGKEDSSGDEKLDELIVKLNGILEQLSKERVSRDKRTAKHEELANLRKAIRNLQVKNDIKTFIDAGLVEIQKYKKILDDNKINLDNVLEILKVIEVYSISLPYLRGQLSELKKTIKSETDPVKLEAYTKLQDNYSKMVLNASALYDNIVDVEKELIVEKGKEYGEKNIMRTEKSVDFLKRNFRPLSQMPITTVRLFWKLKAEAENIRDNKTEEYNHELHTLQNNLEDWAKSKGISSAHIFDKILDFDDKGNWTGDFLRIYNKEFYTKREEAIKKGDFKWVLANTTFDDKAYEAGLARQREYIEAIAYSDDPEEQKKRVDAAIKRWEEAHSKESEAALLNTKSWYRKPLDKYHSDKWVELNKPENKALKDTYDYFQLLLKSSDTMGMIEYRSQFIPSTLRDAMDKITAGEIGKLFSVKGALDKFEAKNLNKFAEIDAIDGSIKRVIPVHFTHDLGVENKDGSIDYSNKSKDLFKVFSIWATQMARYEAMSSIQKIADVLVDIENLKGVKITNAYGKVKPGLKENPQNVHNTAVLEGFVNAYVYGQKGDSADYTIKLNGKEYSMSEMFRGVLGYLSFKTLALNPLSGTSTFVGGTGNAFFQATKGLVFNIPEWMQALKDLTLYSAKTKAILEYLDVNLEDEKHRNSNLLSMNSVVKHVTTENTMVLMKKGDAGVQNPVALAMFANHMVDNGKIVSINDFVKNKHNYDADFYNLSIPEQKALRKVIDNEVKELKETRSLKVISTVTDGKLTIPGIDKNSRELADFRNKIKKVNKSIIGNATRDDLNLIRTTLMGSTLMQFRSWMPQMIAERFGDMTYDADLKTYQYGKSRIFVKNFLSKNVLLLTKELMFGLGVNTQERAKERYAEFKIRMEEEGQDFDMSETEFIDMYIGNIRSQLRELQVMASFMALVFMVKLGPDDDRTGLRKYLSRAMNKYQNEFSFYYSPSEFRQMLKNPVPLQSLLADWENLISHSAGQSWSFLTGDEEGMKENVPGKYVGKSIPIVKEIMNTYSIFDDDFRKEWKLQK